MQRSTVIVAVIFVVAVTVALSSGFLIVTGESTSHSTDVDESGEWDHLPNDGCERHHEVGGEHGNTSIDATVYVCGPNGIENGTELSNDTVGVWIGVRFEHETVGSISIDPSGDRTPVTYVHELGHALYGPNHTDSGIMRPTTDVDIGCDLRPRTRTIAATFNTTTIEQRNGCDVVTTPFGTVGA